MTILNNRRQVSQQVILAHSQKPRHRGKTNPIHRCHCGDNPTCGDRIELTMQLNLEGNIIEDIKFEGEGCAISIASADLMAEALSGKSVIEALEMVQLFRSVMKGEAEFPQALQKLNVLQGVSQFPIRIKCATLCWHTLKAALAGEAS
jgi:nitrogen fixation protein NifU and related proteins